MNNSDWQQRKSRSFARGMGNLFPVFAARARNAEVWDVEGKRYIDFGAGIAVVNTGHSHPTVVDALKTQLDAFSHTCIMVTPYPSAVELAEKLCAVAPIEERPRDVRLHRRRGGGECHQDRPCRDRPAGRDRLQRRLPWPHQPVHGADRQGRALQERASDRSRPDIYHAPFPAEYLGVSADDSLAALEQLFKSDIEPEQGGRHHHRAGAGRGRVLPGAGWFPGQPAGALRPARHPAGRGRNPDRLRAAPGACSRSSTRASSRTS